ncbi:hypothetical protein ACOMHN_024587 [Nucella lapillus]
MVPSCSSLLPGNGSRWSVGRNGISDQRWSVQQGRKIYNGLALFTFCSEPAVIVTNTPTGRMLVEEAFTSTAAAVSAADLLTSRKFSWRS